MSFSEIVYDSNNLPEIGDPLISELEIRKRKRGKRVGYSKNFNDYFKLKYGANISDIPVGNYILLPKKVEERLLDGLKSGEFVIVMEEED